MFFQNFAFTFLCKSQPQICVNMKPQIPSPEKINNNNILNAAGLQTKPQSILRTESGDQTLQLPSSSETSTISV